MFAPIDKLARARMELIESVPHNPRFFHSEKRREEMGKRENKVIKFYDPFWPDVSRFLLSQLVGTYSWNIE